MSSLPRRGLLGILLLVLSSSVLARGGGLHPRTYFYTGRVHSVTFRNLKVEGKGTKTDEKSILFEMEDDVQFKPNREAIKNGSWVKVDYTYTIESGIFKACVVSLEKDPNPPKAPAPKRTKHP